MKRLEMQTDTYSLDDIAEGLCVDIIDKGDDFEAWIYISNYVYKSLMFGIPKSNSTIITREEFMDMVMSNVEDYLEVYLETMDVLNTHFEELVFNNTEPEI